MHPINHFHLSHIINRNRYPRFFSKNSHLISAYHKIDSLRLFYIITLELHQSLIRAEPQCAITITFRLSTTILIDCANHAAMTFFFKHIV